MRHQFLWVEAVTDNAPLHHGRATAGHGDWEGAGLFSYVRRAHTIWHWRGARLSPHLSSSLHLRLGSGSVRGGYSMSSELRCASGSSSSGSSGSSNPKGSVYGAASCVHSLVPSWCLGWVQMWGHRGWTRGCCHAPLW